MSSLFRKSRAVALPRAAVGERVYAIGDIHGRLDCLDEMLDQIATDDEGRTSGRTTLVFLGDYVDRGPDSRAVLERLIAIDQSDADCVFLMGNHEELLLRAAKGERAILSLFDRVGGRETLLSYGVSGARYDEIGLADLPALINDHVPPSHLAFLERTSTYYVSGDYLFVHAGVRPGVQLDQQKPSDLRWIRDEFLRSRHDFGYVVVHGHTVSSDIEVHANRIGIDLGAYATGRLAAIGVHDADRWFLLVDTDERA